MALCLDKQGSGRKRKRSGDKVESKAQGFLGSRRPGTIPAFHAQGWKYNYCVRYDHRSADNGSGHISPSDPPKSNFLNESNNRAFLQQRLSAVSVSHSNLNGSPHVNSVTNAGAFCPYSKMDEKKKSSPRRGKTDWYPAGRGLVSGAEFCPDAIIQYTGQGVKHEESLRIKVRNHLLHRKWKIEFRNDDMQRVRYTSPEGHTYYSLFRVCLDLRQNESENPCTISQDKQESAYSATRHSLPPAVNPDDCRSQLTTSSQSDEVFVQPEYNPQAIEDWCTFGHEEKPSRENKRANLREMTLRARKHLSSVGWKFWHATCSSKKRELRYVSPRGKCFCSLRLACKDSLDAQDNPTSKIVEEQLASGKMSSPSSRTGIQTPSSSMTEFRKPVEFLKKKVLANRKLQETRKDLLATSFLQTKGNLDDQNVRILPLGSPRTGSSSRRQIFPRSNKNSTMTTQVLRSNKRVQQIVAPNLSHREPRTMLSWLINSNVLLLGAKVNYRRKKDALPSAEGQIARNGIKCNCCGNVYTLSGFEAHVGSKNHRPAASIFLEDGRSLMDFQREIRNSTVGPSCRFKDSRHEDKNDHICSVCHYGGELILCDKCPSSFHKHCLGMEDVPDGDWFCPSCCCRICGRNKLEKGVEHPMDDGLLCCAQCEHKYHIGCLESTADKSEGSRKENWFCSKKCEAIYLGLYELLGKPMPVGVDNLTWTLLKPVQLDDTKLNTTHIENLTESHSKLNIALDVMHECFNPIEEPQTGRDILKDVMFCQGSELSRLNFRGFYTVLLEKHDELITVATVRIYGEKVAEMPLVGTRYQYRRKGMCRMLVNVLEKKLVELGVQRLVLPAVLNVLDTWTGSFGFSIMTRSERLHYADCTFLDFQDTIMCHKILMKMPAVESEMQLVRHDGACRSVNIELEGSSAVSEVFQPDCIDNAGDVKQGLVDSAAANCSGNIEEHFHPVVKANQPTPSGCEPYLSDINLECLIEDSTSGKERADCSASNTFNEESSFPGSNDLKCYKRRKII